MVYECLKLSEKYELDYLEVSENERQVSTRYDFYVFNYHHATMGWLDTKSVARLPGLKLTFVLETLRNDPFVLCPPDAFDVYCALDPTMKVEDKRVYAFPRPLEPAPPLRPYLELEIPVIGSFGFATPGKGFESVVEAVNREFERAKIRINIPPGTYSDPATFLLHNRDYAEYLIEMCRHTAKAGVEVEFTREFMNKEELIQWCGQNTLNCFLYDRNQPGLSATTDQAISSGRPLAISTNETFRHIHLAIKPYPFRSLRESIAVSQPEVLKLQDEWRPHNFALRFEEVLEKHHIFDKSHLNTAPLSSIILSKNVAPYRSSKHMLVSGVKRIARNLAPPILTKTMKRLCSPPPPAPAPQEAFLPSKLQPFSHSALQSHSQFNEDLLIDFLLGSKNEGFYVDVGANEPVYNNNTKRFYDRGWSGINIEPGSNLHLDLCKARPRDINLNLGVGSQSGELTFYQIESDPSLSSFDSETAQRMATYFGRTITPIPIVVLPLREILAQHALDKPIDFMSVDAEGVDLDVLESNDWENYRPTLLLVEMNNQPKEIIRFLNEHDFFLVFNNEYNGLFIDLKTSNPDLKTLLRNIANRIF